MHKWGAEERQLSAILHEKRAEVDAALRASIDTPAALKALEQLVRATNTYMNEVGNHLPCPYPIGRRHSCLAPLWSGGRCAARRHAAALGLPLFSRDDALLRRRLAVLRRSVDCCGG